MPARRAGVRGGNGGSRAVEAVEQLTARRNCVLPSLTADHERGVASLAARAGATGKQVADAQHAAVAIEHGCTWVTRDRTSSGSSATGCAGSTWSRTESLSPIHRLGRPQGGSPKSRTLWAERMRRLGSHRRRISWNRERRGSIARKCSARVNWSLVR